MPIQIGAKPDSGFDDPIGMLKDCHRRIEKFLGILCIVAGRAQGRSLIDEEREAVEAALDYFHSGGQRHNADEEESLFPRLRAVAADSFQQIDRLEDDHREANTLHISIESLYRAWMASAALGSADAAQLQTQTDRLKQLYATHIDVEESIVFALASHMLDSESLAAIGAEFQARRGSTHSRATPRESLRSATFRGMGRSRIG